MAFEIVDAKDLTSQDWKNIAAKNFSALYIRQGWPFEQYFIQLAKKFLAEGKKVTDQVIASGDLALGKALMHKKLETAGFLMPTTYGLKDKQQTGICLHFPYILKWIYGFQGKHIKLALNEKMEKKFKKMFPETETLVQEYINADWEYKIVTVGYKALPKILRFKTRKNKIGIDLESFEVLNVEDCKEVVKLAEKASQILGREIAKTDLLEKDGKFYILEVNRTPGLETFESLTGYNAFAEIVRYLNE